MNRHEILNLPNCLTFSRIVLTPVFLLLLFADVVLEKHGICRFFHRFVNGFLRWKLAREGIRRRRLDGCRSA